MKLFEELKEDFNLFRNNNDLYINKVNNISELLNLKNTSKLREDYLPTYFVGNYKKNNMYILFSMNPGFNEEQNKKEESLKNQTFEKYENFMINFYKLFYEHFGMTPAKYRKAHT